MKKKLFYNILMYVCVHKALSIFLYLVPSIGHMYPPVALSSTVAGSLTLRIMKRGVHNAKHDVKNCFIVVSLSTHSFRVPTCI